MSTYIPLSTDPDGMSITLERVVSATSSGIDTVPADLKCEYWNSLYDFRSMARMIYQGDKRLLDHHYLIVKTPLCKLTTFFKHFTLPHLKLFADAHGIKPPRGIHKHHLLDQLQSHVCERICEDIVYIFKERPRARPYRPWIDRMTVSRWATAVESPPPIQAAQIACVQTITPSETSTESGTDARTTGSCEMPDTPATAASDSLDIGPADTTPDLEPQPSTDDNEDGDSLSHLDPIKQSRIQSIIREWQRDMSLASFIRRPCAACSGLHFNKDLKRVLASSVDLSLLRNDDLPQQLLPDTYDLHLYNNAILDPNGIDEGCPIGHLNLCASCHGDLSAGRMPKFALSNWLYYARDKLPPEIATAFKEMSIFEKALICRVRTNSILCRFGLYKDFPDDDSSRNARRHIRGNIISTPFDVARLSTVLPPSPSELRDTMCAIFVSSTMPTRSTIQRLRPILVRKSRVKMLIHFLMSNNKHYSISESFKGFSSEYLDALFDGTRDEGVPSAVRVGHLPVLDALEAPMADYTGRMDGLEGLFMENVAYTSGDMTAQSYREMTMIALQVCRDGRPFLSNRSGTTPVPDIDNPNWLSWAHPDADPFGIGGFNEPRRKRKISMSLQLKHLLNVGDPYFEHGYPIAFDVYNIIRKAMVNTSLRFIAPMSSYARIVDEIANVDRNLLASLRLRYLIDPFYQPQTQQERDIIRIMTSITPVARMVPGSTSQRLRMRNEIRALVNEKGSPTLFITLNPADHHHPIVRVLATRCSSPSDIRDVDAMNASDRMRLSLDHPVACAQFFDAMIKAFTRIVLCHGRSSNRKAGVFGHCDAYYGTVETQGRGSLHCHMLVWLKGHLAPERLARKLRDSSKYRRKLCEWLDSVFHSGYTDQKLSRNDDFSEGLGDLPRHSQSTHPGSQDGPQIADMDLNGFEDDMREFTDELLSKFQIHKHTATCWKYLRPGEARTGSNCRFGLNGETRETTEVDATTGDISLRRVNPRMTHFNPIITFLMKCNTDIKFIGSGEDANAFMYYVTDYITKPGLSIHAGLTALSYAIRQGESKGLFDGHPHQMADEASRKAMTIAINSMLGHQELSHPQVMSFIVGGGEAYTSNQFQPANWAEVLRTVNRAYAHRELKDEIGENEMRVTVSNDNGNIIASNQLLDYVYRPSSYPYNTMSLYTYWASTTKASFPLGSDGFPRQCKSISKFSSSDHPLYRSHGIRARPSRVVPVLLGPRISRKQGSDGEREAWAKEMCILFKHWREATDLRQPGQSWTHTLEEAQTAFTDEDMQIMSNMSILAEARAARDRRPRRRHQSRLQLQTQVSNGIGDTEQLNTEIAMDTIREAEGNVYSTIDISDHHQANTAEDTHTKFLALENMIGREETLMLDACWNASSQLAQPHVSDDSRILDQYTLAQAQAHERFLAAIRTHGRTKSAEKASGKRESAKTQPIKPTATIETLRDDQKGKGMTTSPQKWAITEELVISEGMQKNEAQAQAFRLIANHLIEGGNQLLMYIGGKGGTGKSHVINAVVKLFTALGRSDELRLGAPTGIAASLIGGSTLHSLLCIGPSNKGMLTENLTKEWRNVRYLIIDEVSMLGAQFMATMSSRLSKAKGDVHRDGTKIFGGISIIFTGDFCQLSPPQQPSLFSHRLVRDPSFLDTSNMQGIDAIAGAYLWRQVTKVVQLTKNVRQQEDESYAKLLNKIRNNTCLGPSGEHYRIGGKTIMELLCSRELSEVYTKDHSSLAAFVDAPVIVGSKTLRDAINVRLLQAHAKRLNQTVHLYYSCDSVKGQELKGPIADKLWNMPSRLTKESLGKLPLFIGMRVMVLENISVPLNVVNGSEGVVSDILYTVDEGGRRRATVVYVNIPRCKYQVPGLDKGTVPMFPRPVSVNQPLRLDKHLAKSYRRTQIPIVPAYSYTDYKSQGRTLSNAVVDLRTARSQGVYVMLSRVKTLSGLLILRPFPAYRIYQRMSGELRTELGRLGRLDNETSAEYYTQFTRQETEDEAGEDESTEDESYLPAKPLQ